MNLRTETIWIILLFPEILTSQGASGRSVYWTQSAITVPNGFCCELYSQHFGRPWLFSSWLLFFSSESSRVRRLCNSCILATAALRILLFPEASNRSYQPPFLLITKYSTAFHSSALCLSLNKTMIDVFYHYMLTYLLG